MIHRGRSRGSALDCDDRDDRRWDIDCMGALSAMRFWLEAQGMTVNV